MTDAMNTQDHRPPEAWRSLAASGPGRGTPERDARSLILAEAVVEKIDANPSLVTTGHRNLERWRARRDGTLNRCDQEWVALLAKLDWSEIRTILLDPSEEGTRLRKSHPFVGILSDAEREAIHDAHRA